MITIYRREYNEKVIRVVSSNKLSMADKLKLLMHYSRDYKIIDYPEDM